MSRLFYLFVIFFIAFSGRALWIFMTNKERSMIDRILAAAVPIGFIVTLFRYLARNGELRLDHWAAVRYSAAVAMSKGFRLYSGPTEGVITGWIYPPLSAIAYLPATLFHSPDAGLQAGGLLSGLYFFLPAYLLLRACAADGKPGPGGGRPYLNVAFLLFCICSVFEEYIGKSFILTYVSWRVGADAPAVGCAAMACFLLLRYQDRQGRIALIGSCIFAALATWSKQVTAPLFIVLPAWVLATQGLKAAARHSLILVSCLLVVSTAFCAHLRRR